MQNEIIKRCPNNTRRNPKTGICEPLTDITKMANKRRQKTKRTSTRNTISNPINNNSIIITQEKIPTPSRPLEIKDLDPEKSIPTIGISNVLSVFDITPQKELPIVENKILTPILNIPYGAKKRCPNGTRRNHKTGICENIRIKSPKKYKKVTFNEPLFIDDSSSVSMKPVGLDNNNSVPLELSVELQEKPKESPLVNSSTETVSAELEAESPLVNSSTETVSAELEAESPPDAEETNEIANKESNEPAINETSGIPETESINPIEHFTDTEKNIYLFNKEKKEYYDEFENPDNEFDFLYPTLNDPHFSSKIAARKEFLDYKYDGNYFDDIKKIRNNIEEYAEQLCHVPFELSSHQLFVKNFLSFQTPYNSLLLYHGLGSGKTCSAIGIAEETRSYMKQIGIKQRILVIASPNVQSNFRLQLFDERKLKKISSRGTSASADDVWNINSCIGNSLLKEINPSNLKGLSREKIISQINTIINTYYAFMGYGQFANFITNKIKINETENYTEKEKNTLIIKRIKQNFNNRLIIIDEVHNIRLTDENNNKKTALLLMKVAKYSENMRLLLLSATPMYNSYKEIIWLTNLMNINDKRSIIDVNDVFNKDGEFTQNKDTISKKETGKELLKRKLTGYISYVRGENPFVFPFRIYPKNFMKKRTFEAIPYPTIQMNGKPIEEPIKHLQLFVNNTGTYQSTVYSIIIENLRKKSYNSYNIYGDMREMPTFENMESFGYTLLQTPLEALNIAYPNTSMNKLVDKFVKQDYPSTKDMDDVDMKESIDSETTIISNSIGMKGLSNIVKWEETTKPAPLRFNFEYKKGAEHIFNGEHLHKYSSKINTIRESIMKSTGIVLIYSQYIDGGVIPIALSLEEMGFERYSSNPLHLSLFKKAPTKPIDATEMKPRNEIPEDKEFVPAKYIMITGDKSISPNNAADLKYATSIDNKYGEKVKVIIISKAGAEGLDFKFIRQIHILEPWYNMNRIEQIIGRGVRNLSHCGLPFKERNVELYLHTTVLERSNEEAADLYIYRLAEKKAMQIGKITRLLKEMSVDCILNISQTKFAATTIMDIVENQDVNIQISSQSELIPFTIGDQPFTDVCDYMDNCQYECSQIKQSIIDKPIRDSYNIDSIKINNERIVQRIKDLFREHSFYERKILINSINVLKTYPIEDIYYALSELIKNKNEYLIDKNGRMGNLINKDNYYLFQPLELNDENASIYERTTPIEYKREHFLLEIPKEITNKRPSVIINTKDNELRMDNSNVVTSETDKSRTLIDLLKQIKTNLDYVFANKRIQIPAGDKSWYKHVNHVLDDMETLYGVNRELMEKYVLDHTFDMLMFHDKMQFIQYIYTRGDSEPIQDNEYIKILDYAKMHLDKNNIIVEGNKTAIVLFKDNGWKLFVMIDDEYDDDIINTDISEPVYGSWKEAAPEDYRIFSRQLDAFKVDYTKLNNLIGFTNTFKNREMVFKLKDLRQTRNNIGARCGDSTTRADAIKLLNTLLERNVYTNKTEIRMISFCVIIETLMRYYTDINKNGKIYYLSPEKTIINDIVHYSRT